MHARPTKKEADDEDTLGDLICRSVASADDVQPLIPVTGSRYLIDWANVARRGIGRRFFLESPVFSDRLTAVMPAISGIYPPEMLA